MDAIHTLLPHSADEACREAPPANRKLDAARPTPDGDDLNAARGVLVSLILGGGLWLILLTAGWLIFR